LEKAVQGRKCRKRPIAKNHIPVSEPDAKPIGRKMILGVAGSRRKGVANMKRRNIESVVNDLKELTELQELIKKEIEQVKREAIEYMAFMGTDEVVTLDGKITYRAVISKRFDSTLFKKTYPFLYDDFVKPTSSLRFTFN